MILVGIGGWREGLFGRTGIGIGRRAMGWEGELAYFGTEIG